MRRRINILSDIDWLTIAIYVLIVVFGWMNIYAVSYDINAENSFEFGERYGMQLIWIITSVLFIFVIFILDLRFYSFFAYFIYGLSILFLFLVLVVGKEINYARSWIYIGRFSFQPSEFAKIGTCLVIARYLSSYNIKTIKLIPILITLAFIFAPVGLIALQPDFGSAIIFLSLILILYREGFPGWVLIIGILLSALFFIALKYSQTFSLIALVGIGTVYYIFISERKIPHKIFAVVIFGLFFLIIYYAGNYIYPLFSDKVILLGTLLTALFLTGLLLIIIYVTRKIPVLFLFVVVLFWLNEATYYTDHIFKKLPEHQQRRVNIVLGKESDPYGYEYNINQSKIAIGSGGFSGKGYLQGTQTKFKFVPEQDTDFIFCTVGEEWGFLGTFALLLLYTSLLIRIIIISERQRQKFGRIYGYGVLSILLFHVVINIGMTIGLLPVIGIPLPLFSYGGSSFLTFTILLFILIRLDASRRLYLR